MSAMPEVTKEFNSVSGRYLPKLDNVKVVYDYNSNILRDYIDFNFTKSLKLGMSGVLEENGAGGSFISGKYL